MLFNPGVPDVATLTRDFRGLIDGMGVLTLVAEHYAALYRRGCDLLCERLGVTPRSAPSWSPFSTPAWPT
ncbi:hypothetical protein [Streptomyces sp. NPDC006355]|uniref:hypothetical protein n=1 Tax=Streptomyces sp. NPDC006355 TaxID=3156758 RepID=UPI0033ABA1E4